MKSILFKLNLNGRGVVNFDSNDQKYFTNKHCGTNYKEENLKLAKKAFKKKANAETTYDEYGNEKTTDVEYVLKISRDCLRHAIFSDDYDAINPGIFYNDLSAAYFISSIPGLVRRYMFTTPKGQAYTAKSPLFVTSALETTGAVPYLEVCSVSTKKEKGINSLYYTEEVGDVKYEVKGGIDLKQMQFVSDDDYLGRVGFKSEWLEGETPLLDIVFKQHYGYVPYKVGCFTSTKNTFVKSIAEHGIRFDNDFIVLLVRETLKRLLGVFIKRAGAYAATSSLEIKFVEDGIRDIFDSEDGWIKITADNVDKIDFEVDDFYEEADADAVAKQREEQAEKIKQLKEARKNQNDEQ